MLTKTKVAFNISAQTLFQQSKDVYFWTVTFYTLHDDWECARLFKGFLNHLQKIAGFDDLCGLRVSELHETRGVHYHLLVNQFIRVGFLRRVAQCYGIGRVHVKKCDIGAAGYMSKYLSKQREGPLTESGRNSRRWAKFGKWVHTKVSDIVCCSPQWEFRRRERYKWLGIAVEPILSQCWDISIDAFRQAWSACSEYMRTEKSRMQDAILIALGHLRCHSHGVLYKPCPVGGTPY